MPRLATLSMIAFAGLLAACKGSDDDGGSTPPAASGWTAGVFQPAANFDAECASPRLGIDPETQMPYLDVQGSTVDENNWLRSWSNDLYLWYNEIVDRDPGLYSTSAYFDLLRTEQTTASGAPKDKFHFTYTTDEWRALSQSGVVAGYGVEWVILAGAPPRNAVVAYIEPNSPAAAASIARGARLLQVDGVDFVNGPTQANVDTIVAGLYPENANENHTFQIQDLSGTIRTVNLTSTNVTLTPVQNVRTIATQTGPVGYLLFNDHILTAEQGLIDAITTLDNANVVDLVLDIRYNGGGYLAIASELAYMIAGPAQIQGRIFEDIRFNAKHPSTNPVTGQPLQPFPFADTTVFANPVQLLPTLGLQRVFVLTGPNTCSASESIINSLRGIGVEVVQIGSKTCGKPYGFYPEDNCGTTYFTIQFQGVNALGFGDYADGFSAQNSVGTQTTPIPGCSVADDFTHALGDANESRFAAALAYRTGGQASCPAPSGLGGPGMSKPSNALAAAEGEIRKSPLRENRILLR
ncbi:MAG TPA: S41 family peptidase [Gammaproteobacteria bacterium]